MKKTLYFICFFSALFSLKSVAGVPDGVIKHNKNKGIYVQSSVTHMASSTIASCT